jgi:hypothetical protein
MYKNEYLDYDPVQLQNYKIEMQSSYNVNNIKNKTLQNINRSENFKPVNCSQTEYGQMIDSKGKRLNYLIIR